MFDNSVVYYVSMITNALNSKDILYVKCNAVFIINKI